MNDRFKMTLTRLTSLVLAVAVVSFFSAACNRKPEAHEEHEKEAEGEHAGHAEEGEHAHNESGVREGQEEHDEHAEERAVRLTDETQKEFGIEVGTAGAGKLALEVRLPGEVVPNADKVAHIVPRFAGITKAVRKNIGDKVSQGEVLAVIESNESLTEYEVKSLIDGTVIEKHMTLGELVKENTDAFVVADLSTIWVNLRIYQKDLALIRKGQRARIEAGHGIAEGTGEISYVAPVVDERTRTGLARVVLPNPDGRWRPGLFVTANVSVDEREAAVVVPKSALQVMDEKTCVFIQDEDGFKPRPVELGRSNETHVEIIAGLAEGERYVTKGAFTLKAELQKGAFGDGHAH